MTMSIQVPDELEWSAALPELDATALVDGDSLRAAVVAMYGHVAREERADLHFEVGRSLAEQLRYPPELLDMVPAEAVASFAGVGFHLDLAELRPGEAVLDLGSGSGTDAFCAAVLVGGSGRVAGVDVTGEQLAKARRLRDRDGFSAVEFVEAPIEDLPFPDGSFDVVLSNGVVNLSPAKDRVFAEAARVLRPGGRIVLADIVSGRPLKERTRRDVDLWAACIAGAVTGDAYVGALEALGLRIDDVRDNDYRFVSPRAQATSTTYEVTSLTLRARRPVQPSQAANAAGS